MSYVYRSGFEVIVSDTTLSPTSVYLRKGTIIDSLLNNIIGFSNSILPKHIGTNYVYATSAGELYNSTQNQLDALVSVIVFDDNLNLVSETPPIGLDADNYNEALIELNNSIAALEAEIDALQIAEVLDNVLEVKKETITITGDSITTAFTIHNVIEMYIENLGELAYSSINTINGKDIIFSDSTLNGESIDVVYNTLITI